MSEATEAATTTHVLAGMPITHAGLTAEVFVVRGEEFLVLTRARGGLGGGLDYLPGGIVEPGEDPADAARRETEEESGLVLGEVRILRVWTWSTPQGWETIHATYVADAPAGTEVTLSDEHTANRWVRPADYVPAFASPAMEEAFPAFASFFANVRRNCETVAALIALGASGAA